MGQASLPWIPQYVSAVMHSLLQVLTYTICDPEFIYVVFKNLSMTQACALHCAFFIDSGGLGGRAWNYCISEYCVYLYTLAAFRGEALWSILDYKCPYCYYDILKYGTTIM